MIDTSELPAAIPSLKLKCVAIDTYKENVAYLHRSCALYRSERFQALSIIEIHTADNEQAVIAVLNVVDATSITDVDELGLSEQVYEQLGIPEGSEAV